jgi:hypothetical protein
MIDSNVQKEYDRLYNHVPTNNFNNMIISLTLYLQTDNYNLAALQLWFHNTMNPDGWKYRHAIERWKRESHAGIWNQMGSFYKRILARVDNNFFSTVGWLFDLAVAFDPMYAAAISGFNMHQSLKFIGCLKNEELVQYLLKIRMESIEVLHTSEDCQILESTLELPNLNPIVLDYVFGHKFDFTFKMVYNVARYHTPKYFELSMIRALTGESEFTSDKINKIFVAICLSGYGPETMKKLNFFINILKTMRIKLKISNSMMESISNEFVKHNNGDNAWREFINIIHFIDNIKDMTNGITSFILTKTNLKHILKMLGTLHNKYYFEDAFKKFIKKHIKLRKQLGKPDIVCGYDLIKYYIDCNYQKFPFDIKIEITMDEFEKLCALKPDVRLLKDAYKCIDNQKDTQQVPTALCLENATKRKNCDSVMKFLLEKGGILSVKCIQNILSHYKSDAADDFKYVLAQFIEDQKQREFESRFTYKSNAKVTVIPKVNDAENAEDIQDKQTYVLSF